MAVKGTAKLKRIMYPKGNYETSGGFTIASFEPVNIEEGEIEVNPQFNTFSIKGEMPPLREGEEYYFIVEEGERHPKFGLGYDLTFMRQDVNLDESDESSIRRFLEIILTDRQIDALYDVFDNPLAVIESGDIDKMTEAKGIGKKTAQRIINHYESQKDYSLAYIELGKYQISPSTIRKVVAYYGSPELAIQKVLENPYNLMKIDGYGFKKCDKIFLQLGGKPNAEIRVRSFLVFALQEEASKGHTWTSPQDIFQSTQTYIPNVDKNLIGSILLNDDEFYLSDDRMKISLTSYKVLEEKLAKEILRVNNSESEFVYDDHEEIVHETEVNQGWCFSRQQKDAMLMMLENNISVLQG
ncbi:helix-hairpin-helix domain-containing protein, partial [Bacillus pumilus]|uniref:helix-hairpin-helix domain-containing protein n=1 Tax=Bacillus pumilus TaxID=1408 RepID=UPI0021B179A1